MCPPHEANASPAPYSVTVADFILLHVVTPVLPLSSIEFWELFTTFDVSKGVNGIPFPVGVWVIAGLSMSDRYID